MGRPSHPFPTKTYNIILSKELYEWVMKQSHDRGISGAAIIREILAKEKRIDDRVREVVEALDAIDPPAITVLRDNP